MAISIKAETRQTYESKLRTYDHLSSFEVDDTKRFVMALFDKMERAVNNGDVASAKITIEIM
jgi:hypothetical protein